MHFSYLKAAVVGMRHVETTAGEEAPVVVDTGLLLVDLDARVSASGARRPEATVNEAIFRGKHAPAAAPRGT